jgi:hypothetical protein
MSVIQPKTEAGESSEASGEEKTVTVLEVE